MSLEEARRKLTQMPQMELARAEALPHTLCPGCGIGTILNTFIRAMDELAKEGKLDPNKLVVVSGIGCSGRISGFIKADSMHTTHGRPIAFATGIKLQNPELNVWVFGGDADLFQIGLNHTLQAARRNIDLKVVMVNNFNIAMTGGVPTVTTPPKARTKYSPRGWFERSFNVPKLMAAAGATYIARWTTAHVFQLKNAFKKMALRKGFSFLEVVSQCPVLFGRYNEFRDPWTMLEYFMKNSKIVKGEEFLEEASIELGKPILVGEFLEREAPEYTELLYAGEGVVRK
ncbi:2-oxoglutarate ferredoxin oxidoreductase subunit beta [Ignicoccus islandicus DSM 13165]|uniref:2-oxoacid oxidoreductase (ferredoxin) n=1 Tax=Ignicoccus islandicus DSM 13165 TaxID=940295 RepID=A0A0U2U6L7_9CREN|nr:thiamine pyrophosphate-dependent enzyme [Ignicoccus islandicus]ALU11796.1 2-oxoglutarate ferredoxin oxidoreductase subunit beta [Ignicoccus islandicus DSM 13165]